MSNAIIKTEELRFTYAEGGEVTPLVLDGVHVIGERINPTGKKLMKEALRRGDVDYILNQALTQVEGDALTTEGVEGAAYTADGAVAVKCAAGGYSGKTVTVYVAFDSMGTITNIKVDASTQTAGIGTKTGDESFYSGFVGWDGSQQVSAGSPVASAHSRWV